MANTPVMSLRVLPKHRKLVRAAARALRDQPNIAGPMAALMAGKALPTPHAPALGPFRDEEAALGFIRDRLVAFLKPEEIWLFGSRARGDARPDSDFDILVVLPDDQDADHYRVYEPVMGAGLPCDVVPARRADFEAERAERGSFGAHIAAEGRRLYRRQP